MINFYELYNLFLKTKNDYFFNLFIIYSYIFWLIYLLLKYKEELKKCLKKTSKKLKLCC